MGPHNQDRATTSKKTDVLATTEYFRVDYQERLPKSEVRRRQAIRETLERQYEHWKVYEQRVWIKGIKNIDTKSFLGLDSAPILPRLEEYIRSHSDVFAVLSELGLSTVRGAIIDSYQLSPPVPSTQWLYEQYCRYAIRIFDFGEKPTQYRIPLLEATVVLGRDQGPADEISKLLPEPTSTFRLIIFPQTRCSFIEDEVFHALYPLPEGQSKIMSHTILQHFQGTTGYYNILPSPFAESFIKNSFDDRKYTFLAAMYPIIDFEFLINYEQRKLSERSILSVQRHGPNGYPVIAQYRYNRKFDFPEENQLGVDLSEDEDFPERIQSARALYEYACSDFDTLSLDRQQTSILEEHDKKRSRKPHLLVVDPLWIVVFPDSSIYALRPDGVKSIFIQSRADSCPGTICVFLNETTGSSVDDRFKEIWEQQQNVHDWADILVQIIRKADRCMGSYEPTYRKRLAKLQFQINASATEDQTLVKKLSDYLTELTILLDPLEAQINIIRHWQRWINSDMIKSRRESNIFEEDIKAREDQLCSLRRLQERAKESQALLFQISNTATAYLQSQLVQKSLQETQLQVELAKRAERQNNSVLIFTIITVIFLPLSFFTSYFGMNTKDIRGSTRTQSFFWVVAAPVSVIIVLVAAFFAFRLRAEHFFNRLRRKKNPEPLSSMHAPEA